MCENPHGSDLRALAEQYLLLMESRGRRPGTLYAARRGLEWFVGFLARRGRRTPCQVRPRDVEAFAVWAIEERLKVLGPFRGVFPRRKIAVLAIGTVRGFCRWLVQVGEVLLNPSITLEVIRYIRRLPRVLDAAEVERLLASADGTSPVELRDRAALELLYSSGLRSGELLALNLADLDLAGGEVLIRRGKGGKSRRVPVGPHAVRALMGYFDRGRWLLGLSENARSTEAVFLTTRGTRLSLVLLGKMVRRRVRDLGLEGHVTPHTLRHTAAVHLLKGGADLRHIQEFLGHADADTTAHYTRLTVEDLKEALLACHPRARLEK